MRGALALVLVIAVAWGSMQPKKPQPTKPAKPSSKERAEMQRLIRLEAERQGVPAHIALAFADAESGFNPKAEGDKDWHLRKGGELYRKNVLGSKALANNPWRNAPELWHSYGLFQLLAPYFSQPAEDPRALLDPKINITRGVGYIRRLLLKHGGDVDAVRLAYTGNPGDLTVRANILSTLHAALDTWSDHDQA